MKLDDNELHIWRYTISTEEYEAERTAPLLSEQERKRCAGYLREEEKIRYTGNHRVIRQILAKYLSCDPASIAFDKATQGKPFVKDSELFFSYSYRGNMGLLAVTRKGEAGIDIEKMKTLHDLPTFADFSFSEKEKQIIFSSDEKNFQDVLFTFWTFKEAIIKCLGVGLNADLTQIDLSVFFYREQNPLAFDHNQMYTIHSIAAPEGCKAAIAIKGSVSCTEFNYPD